MYPTSWGPRSGATLHHATTFCNTLQHSATPCSTLQHNATRCVISDNTLLQHQGRDHTYCNTRQHTATHCITLHHAATHYTTLQHTATHWNEGRKRVPMNLHRVGRSARPTSRWAPKAHRMMGKTQKRHCERSFGTNMLVLGTQRDNFLSPSDPL